MNEQVTFDERSFLRARLDTLLLQTTAAFIDTHRDIATASDPDQQTEVAVSHLYRFVLVTWCRASLDGSRPTEQDYTHHLIQMAAQLVPDSGLAEDDFPSDFWQRLIRFGDSKEVADFWRATEQELAASLVSHWYGHQPSWPSWRQAA